MENRAEELVRRLKLEEHPEGGYYRETWRSPTSVLSPIVNAQRSAVTDIYFLLTKGQVSRFHKVKHDEIWNFYEGSPLRLYVYDPKNQKLSIHLIGPIPGCSSYKIVVQNNFWQAAESLGEFSLAGCTVAPGFDFGDFSFLQPHSQISREMIKKGLERLV